MLPLHEQHEHCQLFASLNSVSKIDKIWSLKFFKIILKLIYMVIYIDNADILQCKQCLDQKNYSKDNYCALNTFIIFFANLVWAYSH